MAGGISGNAVRWQRLQVAREHFQNIDQMRLTPKARVKFDERDDGSPEPQIPADLGCACANLYGKMLES
jgi:hypothetical protein